MRVEDTGLPLEPPEFEEEELAEVEPYTPRYGLGDITHVECRNEEGVVGKKEVTDEERQEAENVTCSGTLDFFDKGLQEVSPALRRYGGTLMAIATRFQEERSTIEEEMTRIAQHNLRCIVSGKLGPRRVLNLGLAEEIKRNR